jgi:bifunctional DNA-binding transcriptional regulator/antitoxin component of YhaV-PrlF toxin-antitoxin module
MTSLKLVKTEQGIGVVLPANVLERLEVGEGSMLYLYETTDGIELTTFSPELKEQRKIASEVMDLRQDALKRLAE